MENHYAMGVDVCITAMVYSNAVFIMFLMLEAIVVEKALNSMSTGVDANLAFVRSIKVGNVINLTNYPYADEKVSYFSVIGFDVGFSIINPISTHNRSVVVIEGVFSIIRPVVDFSVVAIATVADYFTPH